MTGDELTDRTVVAERHDRVAAPGHGLDSDRRAFLEQLGAGVLITFAGVAATGPERQHGTGRPIVARLHIGEDGMVTVMTGKVEVGQGSRAQLTQAAAEELGVAPSLVRMVMADTALTPDDGGTFGSQTTPRTVPAVRQAAATARRLLGAMACALWDVETDSVTVTDGVIVHAASDRSVTFAAMAQTGDLAQAVRRVTPEDVEAARVDQWKVMGETLPRPGMRDIVTGAHRYPSDIVRPGMLYGKVLRPPSYGARLLAIDLAPAAGMPEAIVVHDGDFVGCAAPNSWLAEQAVEAVGRTARWEEQAHPSSDELFGYLKDNASQGDVPRHVSDALAQADRQLEACYEISYIQHVPMEPRAAVAEWDGDRLTVWTGSQVPTRVQGELQEAFHLAEDQVRVIIPDTGGGFGGKHSGEAAVEAARLARATGCPVHLLWTRHEEFTWAYFRPAGVIELRGALDGNGHLAAYHCFNINSGGSGIQTPYEVPHHEATELESEPPLRQGSYRALAATANHFARESFMDELATAAGAEPLAFRRQHLPAGRLRDVLEAAAERFGWAERDTRRGDGIGFGLSCGTEKGSFVAACAEVFVDRQAGVIEVRQLTEAFECGAIINPPNLQAQVEGAIIQGLGGALSEAVTFENGRITNATLARYRVPRFPDVPPVEVVLVNRPDLESVGGGETPIVAVAPAIGNAVFDACGVRLRRMPMLGHDLRQT